MPKDSASSPFNAPGKWNAMISYVQKESGVHATRLHGALGVPTWLDVMMTDKSVEAMQEAVKNSVVVIVLLSPTYFQSEYCCKELRWAKAANNTVITSYSSDFNVGDILKQAPKDLKSWIQAIDSKKLDNSDPELFAVGVRKLRQAANGALDPDFDLEAWHPNQPARPPKKNKAAEYEKKHVKKKRRPSGYMRSVGRAKVPTH